MSYRSIDPPFDQATREKSKKEIDSYSKWYRQVIPNRIIELDAEVRLHPQFQDWMPDKSHESLAPLGKWFEGQVQVRRKTETEANAERAHVDPKFWMALKDYEFTERTISLILDVSIYLGEVFLHTFSDARRVKTHRNRHGGFTGCEVIEIPRGAWFVPDMEMFGFARDTVEGKRRFRLEEVIDLWRPNFE
ncbi:MAG TPA: hypothetical protein VI893_10540 [Thermoplasmata archaeon]|nr:hypothetical protein [Thermoplasmata archaeon]